MADIFLSYSSKDSAQAEEIADAFEEQGWSVSWDRNTPPEQELESAKCVVVLLTESSLDSRKVRLHLSFARARSKLIVALLLDDLDLPKGYGFLQPFDLRARPLSSQVLEEVAATLRSQ